MRRIMLRRALYCALLTGLTAGLAACGGGGSGTSSSSSTSSSTSSTQSMGTVPLSISDAASDDWATVGVRVLSIALVPQGGGSAVTVYSAPSPAPYVNLVQLDQLSEILGNVSVPVGTYTSAILTLAANPGDVLLTAAADPESGFPLAGGTSVPPGQIEIQHTQGSSGNLTVALTVNLVAPLVVSTSSSNALDLEFDLAHPAFIVAHNPPAADGATVWAVNFSGPVRHHPVHDISALLLRHTYGTVTAVSSAAITIDKDFPVYPATNPETEITSDVSLTIDADSVNGTIVYDLDAGTRTVVENFAAESSLANRFVRVAARYQDDGSLTAVRVWVSSEFAKVWISPEGHVLNVDTATDTLTVSNENGVPVQVAIDSGTLFFYRTPAAAQSDATAIGQGTGFLANLVRGFKVHVSSMDPLQVPMVANLVEIEDADFGGMISGANSTGFTYSSAYRRAQDNYSLTLPYISSEAKNGFDDSNDQITGFKWWDFTLPTTVDWGSSAVSDFVAATNGAVNLGGSIGDVVAWGASGARWGDGVSGDGSSGWHLNDAVLMPAPLPLGTVTSALSGTSFAMSVLGASQPATVDLDTNTGSATLVYQVNRSGGTVTITPLDIAADGGLATLQAALTTGAVVKVWSVPQAPVPPATTGTLKAYVLIYYTGTMPQS